MKKVLSIFVVALLAFTAPATAQEKAKQGVKKVWKGTKKGASAVGNKTAEVSVKGAARVADKKSDTWIGPEGQVIFTTEDKRYYWVNGKGKRIFVSESALKARNK